jgi:hypothetical protein
MALTEASPRNRTILSAAGRVKVTLSGTVAAGDAIGYASGWKRALATVGTAIQTKLIALEPGVSGNVIDAAIGPVEISGFTSGTPGGLVYNEEGAGVGGGYTETAPSTTGDVNTIIGHIVAADRIILEPSVRAGSTA